MKNLFIGLVWAFMLAGCVSTQLSIRDNLENNLNTADLAVTVAKEMIRTERLSDEYSDDVDELRNIVGDVRDSLAIGDVEFAIKTWQDGVKIMLEINGKIYDAKNNP